MKRPADWGRVRREWGAFLAGVALVVAMPGCLTVPPADLDPGQLDSATGLFVNTELGSPVIAAGRSPSGDSFFVFGRRDARGNPTEVTAISTISADGDEAGLAFENGWPVYATGDDGRYGRITYSEVTPTSMTATLSLFDADDGLIDMFAVSIDLERTLAEVAALVEQVTGRTLDTSALPEKLDDVQKTGNQQLLIAAVVVPIVLVVVGGTLVIGQILGALFQAISLAVRSVLLVIFAPLFLVTGVLGQTGLTPQEFALIQLFGTLPPPPQGVTIFN